MAWPLWRVKRLSDPPQRGLLRIGQLDVHRTDAENRDDHGLP
jgi:hypothetical protein